MKVFRMTLRAYIIENEADREVLCHESKNIPIPLTLEIRDAIQALKEAHSSFQGVGLAAPQIGIPYKIICVEINASSSSIRSDSHQLVPPTIFLNPQYSPIEEAGISSDFEGCFSVRDLAGYVPRYNSILFSACDESGETLPEKRIDGFFARVLQHEVDHLYGTLIKDRLTPDCEQGTREEMLEKRYQEASADDKVMMDEIIKKRGEQGKTQTK
jgi:peptide deformylase